MAIDPAARNPEFRRLTRLQAEAFAKSTPYHSLELNDGQVIPGLIGVPALRARLDSFGLPESLDGKRVLDIGAASGWNSFECERRGADVVAMDYVEYEELTLVRRLRQSKIEYAVIDLDELTPERFGYFDYVLFFGVLYHLRHPLQGLERVCAVTRDTALVESFVVDEVPSPERCHLEFYETDELGGQIDNWCGPTTQCLMALARSAGFADVEFLYAHSRRCGLSARRRWPVARQQDGPAPFLCSAVNNRHHDGVFHQGKDEYLVISFLFEGALAKEDLRLEVDRLGVPALFLKKHDAGFWQANCKVPPGLTAGEHAVRVGTAKGGYSDNVRFRVFPAGAARNMAESPFIEEAVSGGPLIILRCENTMDGGRTFQGLRNEKLIVQFTQEGEELDLTRVQAAIDNRSWPLLSVERPAPDLWQANLKLRGLRAGEHSLRLRTSRSDWSEPVALRWEPLFGDEL